MTVSARIPLTDGRYTVPGNRWDLAAGLTSPPRTVAVVVPYFEQQTDLDRTLAALQRQDHPADLLEVVVADDGSASPPVIHCPELRCTVVRQQNQGFRAAAARNLGVAATSSDIICFLDADTVPEPTYITNLVMLPSVVPDALVVGRRRHAELDGWTPDRLSQWWSGGPGPRELPEPNWLTDGYRETADLLHIDSRSYRYLISSVMCCSRELFDDVGGFDESFVGYGGEDWEFAHRALACGAVLQHARAAVAWHNGPDWGARTVPGRAAAKNAEAMALSRLIPDPDARTHGLRYEVPDVAVELDARSHGAGSLVTTMACFLHLDVGVWITGADDRVVESLRLEDPRIRFGAVPDRIRKRCRFVITVDGRAVLPQAGVDDLIRQCSEPGVGAVEAAGRGVAVRCRASWMANRARRWSTGEVRLTDPGAVSALGSVVRLPGDELGLTEIEPDADLSW
jgi:GT2 family glycosyltransferase